jgi:HNH endonuclease
MKSRDVIVERLAASLQKFYPEFVDSWMCPTCLRAIPCRQPEEASEAHIVPQAAGGSITTVLCRQCNSQFGAQQDRWLGEFLRMLRSNLPFPFSAPTLSHVFELDGFRVGGTYDIQPDTGVHFTIEGERTNPATNKAILRSSLIALLSRHLPQRSPERHTVSFQIPILEHKEVIEIGFLTAAYLLWFKELGYSWALQRHLEPIREQIRNPTRQVLPPKFSAICEGSMVDPPWIGIGEVAGELALLAAIRNHVVFLPPADRPNFYDALPDDFQGLRSDIQPLQFYKEHQFGGPVGILFGVRAAVVPDIIQMGTAQCFLIHVPPGGGAPQILYPLPEDQYERALRSPNLMRIDMRFPNE